MKLLALLSLGVLLLAPACVIEEKAEDDPEPSCESSCWALGNCNYLDEECGCAPLHTADCQEAEICASAGACCVGVDPDWPEDCPICMQCN